jgi:hypothetical protein
VEGALDRWIELLADDLELELGQLEDDGARAEPDTDAPSEL